MSRLVTKKEEQYLPQCAHLGSVQKDSLCAPCVPIALPAQNDLQQGEETESTTTLTIYSKHLTVNMFLK